MWGWPNHVRGFDVNRRGQRNWYAHWILYEIARIPISDLTSTFPMMRHYLSSGSSGPIWSSATVIILIKLEHNRLCFFAGPPPLALCYSRPASQNSPTSHSSQPQISPLPHVQQYGSELGWQCAVCRPSSLSLLCAPPASWHIIKRKVRIVSRLSRPSLTCCCSRVYIKDLIEPIIVSGHESQHVQQAQYRHQNPQSWQVNPASECSLMLLLSCIA